MVFSIEAFAGKMLWTVAIIAIAGCIGVGGWFFLHLRKYCDKVVILKRISEDGTLTRRFDRGGVFKVKGGGKEYRLFKSKTALDISKYTYISNDKKGRSVFLYQFGEGNYTFALPKIDDTNLNISVGQEDLTGAIRDYDRFTNIFSQQTWIEKALPLLVILVTAFAIIVMLAILFQKFEVLQGVASSLQETARIIAQAKQAGVASAAPV